MLICDLDNTLSPHFTTFPTRKVIEFCHKVQMIGIKLAIVSNNSKKRVTKYVSRLTPDVVIANAHKPLKRKIMKMLDANNLKPSEVIMMGDQFITDV
jgi:HAD superfamily phosphatase (TIGR01668 family)